MKILSIETSSKVCAVALMEDDKLINEKILEDENTHSVKLMPLVDELLKKSNITLNEIDLFACVNGPGSFTGIRIGIATVKAFADATNKKTIGISSLEALAYNVEENGIICAVIDAKNENVYSGFFEKSNCTIKQLKAPEFNTIKNIVEQANNIKENIIFVGDAVQKYKDSILEVLNKKAVIINEIEKNKLNARNIALAAYNKKQEAGDTSSLIPTYLRKSNAER